MSVSITKSVVGCEYDVHHYFMERAHQFEVCREGSVPSDRKPSEVYYSDIFFIIGAFS